jgi:CRP-like cAMP-binding protein
MDHNLILSTIAKHINLSDEEEIYFTSLLDFKKVKSKKLILREGEVCKYSAFVTKGSLRGYTIDKNGFEHILGFAPKGWWMADMHSLITQKPGVLNIEAIEDTEILCLSKKDQEKLYQKLPKFERFFRILSENSLAAHQQRLIDNLSLTAQERYLKFCKYYPGVINTLTQKQVAAYIGVTPEFLSKMKKTIR